MATFIGTDSADSLVGDADDDFFSGRGSADTLEGGAGSDVFRYWAGHGADVITDFDGAGGDRIELETGLGGIGSAAGVLDLVRADGAGGSIVQLGNGNSITLTDIAPSSLVSDYFELI